MIPQLAESVDPAEIPAFVGDPNWCFEQKLDGVRLLCTVQNGTVTGYNRRGVIDVDPQIKEYLSRLPIDCALDGEVLDGTFWIFDTPIIQNIISASHPLHVRRAGTEAFVARMEPECPKIRLLPSFSTAKDKHDLALWCFRSGAEGVMIKHIEGAYESGTRSANWRKAKFVKSCDAFITAMELDGKRNAMVAVWDGDQELEIGTVGMTDARLSQCQIGDVLEVRYLYASKDRRLVQPRVLRIRPDKPREDCYVEQLQFTNKQAIYQKGTFTQ